MRAGELCPIEALRTGSQHNSLRKTVRVQVGVHANPDEPLHHSLERFFL